MSFVIEPAPVMSLPVVGTDSLFPVNEIYCVGRNYADHAIEMGGDPDREPSFFFMKPGFAILTSGEEMNYPELSTEVHHEVELVVALGKGGRNVAVAEAMSLVFGYGVGIDMTRRDLQAEAKDKSRPWEAAKTFWHAAPCSDITPIEDCGEINEGKIHLDINNERRQSGDVNQMIWKVPEVISRLSTLFVLSPGDLIFTGTPAGVGPIERGDEIVAKLDKVAQLKVKVV